MLGAAPQGDPGWLRKAGGIEADARLAAAADIWDRALRPGIMRLGPPGVILPPGHFIAAPADLQGDGAGFEDGGVARRPRPRREAVGLPGKAAARLRQG